MDIQKRVFGEWADYLPQNDDIIFDINTFITRFLLFDKIILNSIRLKEFRYLIKIFGIDGVIDIIKSGAIIIHCYGFSIAQMTQERDFRFKIGQKNFIMGPYYFELVKEAHSKREKNLNLIFEGEIDTIEQISIKEKIKLKNEILSVLETPPPEFGIESLNSFLNEVKNNTAIIESSIKLKVKKKYGIDLPDFYLKIHQTAEKVFNIETSLTKILKVNSFEAHQIIQQGILGISSIGKRIEEMKLYSALSGFREEEIKLFEEKLNGLEKFISSKEKEDRFKRIVTIKGFPEIEESDKRIDARKLINLRESNECRQFREWLPSIDSISDKELSERLECFMVKFSEKFNCRSGEFIKFLVISGLGLIPFPLSLVGVGLSALDTFLLKNILQKNGPVTFINKMYPTIFKQ